MPSTRALLARFWSTSRPLTLVGLGSGVLLLACLFGLAFDHRVITGMPAWDKPTKFAISSSLYTLTLVWMLGLVQGRAARWARVAAALTALGFVVELTIIVTQVLRGVASHFNESTPLNATLYGLMGLFVVLIWAMTFVIAVVLLFQRLENRLLLWSIRLGLIVSLLGGSVGILMVLPTSMQLKAMDQGGSDAVIGAHTVGAVDGGPGLPFLGWSTQHGDLRVAHFFGLHGLQALPLLGLLITLLGRRFAWTARQQLWLLWTGAAAYVGLFAVLLWQALRGQSVVAPDLLTALVSLAWLVLIVSGVFLSIQTPRRRLSA